MRKCSHCRGWRKKTGESRKENFSKVWLPAKGAQAGHDDELNMKTYKKAPVLQIHLQHRGLIIFCNSGQVPGTEAGICYFATGRFLNLPPYLLPATPVAS